MTKEHYDDPKTDHESLERLPIILLYAILGPPVGAIIFLLGALLISIGDSPDSYTLDIPSAVEMLRFVSGVVLILLFAMMASYVFGFMQAFFTGLLLAEAHARTRGAGYLAAFLAPLAISAPAWAVMVFFFDAQHDFAASLAAVGIASSLSLRFLFRGLFAKR